MIGLSSSPSNCRPPCIATSSPTPRSLRRSTVKQSSPPSLWRRCWRGSCRRIVHLFGHGVQRAVPVEFVDGHHAVLPKRRRLNERAPDAARIVVLLAALEATATATTDILLSNAQVPKAKPLRPSEKLIRRPRRDMTSGPATAYPASSGRTVMLSKAVTESVFVHNPIRPTAKRSSR